MRVGVAVEGGGGDLGGEGGGGGKGWAESVFVCVEEDVGAVVFVVAGEGGLEGVGVGGGWGFGGRETDSRAQR